MTQLSIIAVLCAGLAGNAPAQEQTPTPGWANLIQLAPGAQIRVTLSSGRTVRGDLQKATSDSLTINGTANQETLSRAEIGRVQLKRKGHRGRNALIGFAIGAGGGLAVGAAVDHHDARDALNIFPSAGKAIITPLGAIIGAVVGVAIPSGGWHEIYRAP
jgi:hypothetical protein